MNTHQIEKELWEAADQLRANSKLTAAEYSMLSGALDVSGITMPKEIEE